MSSVAKNQVFSAAHTIGGLIPANMLVRIAEGKDIKGAAPSDYGVIGKRSVRDEAERHWDYLKSVWRELRDHLPVAPEAEVPSDPTGRAIAEWLMPLFEALGFGRRLESVGPEGIKTDDGTKTFLISNQWRHVPMHLVAWNANLDKRPGGAGTVPPQSLVQECLNRTDANLWAVLTNGRQLRLLRDSSALATASYVEIDLEAIFDGELFSEFVLLYRLLHESRFAVEDGAAASACWLEKWRSEAIESGTRALEQLRKGVQQAITALGTGFLRHPANDALRNDFDAQSLHNALLRLVYRLLFLFVAEDRDALHSPGAGELERKRYANYFSSARLRDHARRRRGTAHSDLYQALRIVLDALGDEDGRPELGLPGIGGLFDEAAADTPLRGLSLSNEYLLQAVRHLAQVKDAGSRRVRAVDYRHLDAEELGSVYESLLELVPKYSAVERKFELVELPGNTRKTTGSYYTPSSLIDCLLDSTLDPVIDDAVKRGEQKASAAGQPDPSDSIVEELLSLTVCDPACGSGHFLVAAARRIAKSVAAVRERNPEPTLDAMRHALHEVVARCIYGVDLNPMAVELAKVSLWLEALEPGKPLSFLDAHIKHGNALIGATPTLMSSGIPDKAFKHAEGDEEDACKSLATQNEMERKGNVGLFEFEREPLVPNAAFASSVRRITSAPADTLADVRQQSATYEAWARSVDYLRALHLADAWCAAFTWVKQSGGPMAVTNKVFRELQDESGNAASRAVHEEIVRQRNLYRFFHWHLEFPEVFFTAKDDVAGSVTNPETGWAGGFSCVLGNPPWDKVDFEDKKYFATVEPAIAETSGVARRERITAWEAENRPAGLRYREARRKTKATFHFAANSGAFPLCARGLTVKGVNSLQTDTLFAELFTSMSAPNGRCGLIIPSAIATGAGAQYLFAEFTATSMLSSLYDFENRRPKSPALPEGGKWFESVDSRYKFCLLSLTGREHRASTAHFGFFLTDIADVGNPNQVFALSPTDVALMSPNTGTVPVFRTQRDADITAAIYRKIPVLWNEKHRDGNSWRIRFKRLFDMTDDSDVFRSRTELEDEGWQLEGNVFERGNQKMVPLYEGKMARLFDHRWNTFFDVGNDDRRQLEKTEKDQPVNTATPRYWVAESGRIAVVRKGREVEVPATLDRLQTAGWSSGWLIGWRDVCRATDERTAIPAFIPRAAVGHKFPLMLPQVQPCQTAALVAAQSSLVYDYVSRQKLGGVSMGLFIWKQLPVPTPKMLDPHLPFITRRVVELVYTAHDMAPLARDLGDDGAPFRWNENRRAQLRAELDAFFFHLYGLPREDVVYVLESFQSQSGGLKHNEIAKYGEYRTKRLVLSEFDRMSAAGFSLDGPLVDSANYTSTLEPPPGRGPRHPAKAAED